MDIIYESISMEKDKELFERLRLALYDAKEMFRQDREKDLIN